MPNSPGSMVNQYRLDEDDVERHLGVGDLFITVDKPESHVTAIETFITYRVVTKVGHLAVWQNKHVTFFYLVQYSELLTIMQPGGPTQFTAQ